jgi:hypothetical protein
MADEVKVSVSLQCDNGNFSERFAASGVKADQITQAASGGVIIVGTAVQTLTLSGVGNPGYAGFRNMSTHTAGTHAVFIGTWDGTNSQEMVELQRGMAAVMPLKNFITIGVRSVTSSSYPGDARLQYLVLQR